MAKPNITTTDILTDSQYVRHTKSEIKEAALGLLTGAVFASWQLPPQDQGLMQVVFLPLLGIDDLTVKMWKRDEIEYIYGHIRDSTGQAINGIPCFTRFRTCTRDDANRIIRMAKLLEELDELD